jgi:hypothetical protein
LTEFINGNYGFLGLMDKIFGTDAKWKETYDKRKADILAATALAKATPNL